MKLYVLIVLIAATSASPHRFKRGIIHEEHSVEPHAEEKSFIGESNHHHHVEHEHAKSHQSVKFEHFHPVPVYVKKEHSHLLKHPLEKGKSEHKLKQIHPETEHKHGGGLVLEEHRSDLESEHGGFSGGFGDSHSFSGHDDAGGFSWGLEKSDEHGFQGWGEGLGESEYSAQLSEGNDNQFYHQPAELAHLSVNNEESSYTGESGYES